MKKPQVFISFRGKDERDKLLPHLRHHLEASASNVKVFSDEDLTAQPLERLYDHIRDSWMVIVIFSVSYLESYWCLNELVQIKKCLETQKIKFVIPIFYKVEAYEVKEQKGEFGANFLALENKFPDMVKKWKKALGFVANYSGLTYKESSLLSELDFIKKVVKKVDEIFAENVPKEIFDKSQLHLSKTLEALNLETRSYIQGFMLGSAWKDLNSFVQSRSLYEIPLPETSIQFPMNRQRFNLQAQRNESLEDATTILALHMKGTQQQPEMIFSNWDNLDPYMKNYIIYYAHEKRKMIKSYNEDVDPEPLFRSNFSHIYEEPMWDKTLEPKGPQVLLHHDHRRAYSFHNNREQFYTLPYKTDSAVEPLVQPLVQLPVKPLAEPPFEPLVEPLVKFRAQLLVKPLAEPPAKPLVEAQGNNENISEIRVVSKRRAQGNAKRGCFTSMCYCFKSCVCLT